MVLGLARARRGNRAAWGPLDQARSLAEPGGELHRIGPVQAATAECLWLDGREGEVAEATRAALELARRPSIPRVVGELAAWRRRAGVAEEAPPGAAEPFAFELAGRWERAEGLWRRMGCPYDAALVLAGADRQEPLRRALEELRRLGPGRRGHRGATAPPGGAPGLPPRPPGAIRAASPPESSRSWA